MDTAEKERREILRTAIGPSARLFKGGAIPLRAALRAMAEAERRAFERGRAAGREEAAAIADEYHVFETSPAIIASRIRSLPTPPLSKREGAEQ